MVSMLSFFVLTLASSAVAQGNGRLQLHFMDVGQGDGAVLITPGGQSVLFDKGVLNQCSAPVSYLQRLGLTRIDYHIASHYHACWTKTARRSGGGNPNGQTQPVWGLLLGSERSLNELNEAIPVEAAVPHFGRKGGAMISACGNWKSKTVNSQRSSAWLK
jgi:hypothetical protein